MKTPSDVLHQDSPPQMGPREIIVPFVYLELAETPSSAGLSPWTTIGERTLFVRDHGNRPAPEMVELPSGDRFMIIGRVIVGDAFDARGAATLLVEQDFSDAALASLNGEFLILHSPPARDRLSVVTCRFGFPPLWVRCTEGSLVMSTAFAGIWDHLRARGGFDLNTDTFFDSLLYKRVVGHKSPDRHTSLLPPARLWTFDGRDATMRRYWRPDFRNKQDYGSLEGAADRLVDLIRQSVRRRTSDGLRYALFLSGGMDTRLLAATFATLDVPLHAITINAYENREVEVARAVAREMGIPHTFLRTEPGHYGATLPQAVRLSAGTHYPMCMFHGHEETIGAIADAGFHGHAFDCMFQGMYLPKKPWRLAGRELYYGSLDTVPEDVIGHFIHSVPYRLKGTNVLDCSKPEWRDAQLERLRAELEPLEREGREISNNRYDVFEHILFHNMALHYSVSDHWGINTNIEQRTLAFDNAIGDFYRSLPVEYRFDARIQRMALRRLSPRLAQMRSANHGLPIALSSGMRTVHQVRRALMGRLGLGPPRGDDRFERMGLPASYLFQNDWKVPMQELATSERLEQLPYLDVGKVHALAREALDGNGPVVHEQFLALLMTVDQFLKSADQPGGGGG